MSFRTVRNPVLISFVAVAGSGCSVLFVNGSPSDHDRLTEGGRLPDCSDQVGPTDCGDSQ